MLLRVIHGLSVAKLKNTYLSRPAHVASSVGQLEIHGLFYVGDIVCDAFVVVDHPFHEDATSKRPLSGESELETVFHAVHLRIA